MIIIIIIIISFDSGTYATPTIFLQMDQEFDNNNKKMNAFHVCDIQNAHKCYRKTYL